MKPNPETFDIATAQELLVVLWNLNVSCELLIKKLDGQLTAAILAGGER